jgi:hypothetical protein
MNLKHTFPELNEAQLRMLERYIEERKQEAIETYKRSSR